MEKGKIVDALFEELAKIAPEADRSQIEVNQPLREQVDLDSLDSYRYLVRVHERFQVDIPDTEYRQMKSLNDLADFIERVLRK